ncbi:MAG: oxidoreductase [Dehalococcoidia bacterium]|nr:oxidoreductase [Dehalococcoidia bacterium]
MALNTGTIAGNWAAWQAAEIVAARVETAQVKTLTLRPQTWRSFRAGQHLDVRLTAPDGYQAQRSYSIASAPEQEGTLDLTIELMADGEVSPYFHEVAQAGDRIEVRGPIGGPFTWTAGQGGPLLLVAGGSGIVPLMAMLRHRANAAPSAQATLLYSSRGWDEVIYREELERRAGDEPQLRVLHTLTRSQPAGWQGFSRRVDDAMLGETLVTLAGVPLCYVCGPSPFVEAVAEGLVAQGVPPERVRTERFGPSGA